MNQNYSKYLNVFNWTKQIWIYYDAFLIKKKVKIVIKLVLFNLAQKILCINSVVD